MQKLTRSLALLVSALLLPAPVLAQVPHLRGRGRLVRPHPVSAHALAQASPKKPAAPASAKERTTQRRNAFKKKHVPIKLDFDRVDITQVVKTISDITGKNFILPDNIRGKVTIISPTAVSPKEAYAAFLAALEANNLAVYPVGKFLKIVPKKDAQRANIPTYVEEGGYYPWNEQMITKLYRLQHVDADQVSGVLKQLESRDGNIQTVPPNLLIITDVGLNVHRMERIIKQIDMPTGADEIRVLQVKYANAKDLADKIMQIFQDQAPTNGRQPNARFRRRPFRPGQPNNQQGDVTASVSKVIADDRTNKLVVIADEKSFKQITDLLAQLDVPTEGEGQVHVHYLANANAEDLAQTLSQLAQGGGTAQRRVIHTPRGTQNTPEGAAALFQGDVKITADKGTNSLVIIANYNDYKNLSKVIDKLDIPQRQVFVEAVIMEVGLDTNDQFGLSFHTGAAPKVGGSGQVTPVVIGSELGGLNSLSIGSLLQFGGLLTGIQGPAVPGTQNLGVNIPSFGVVLQALRTDSNVNILSTPDILTSNNKEAEIAVGQNVPFQAGFAPQGVSSLLGSATGTAGTTATTGGLGSLLGSLGGLSSFYAPIQRQNVELKLKVKPQINESDFVRLDIQEQTEEIASTDRVLGPTTSKRSAKTTVVAKDGETVVIGGLIQNRTVETVNKVPILGDIPVIGWLFRNTTKKIQKTNLLLFLTPYIIKSPADFRRIFEEKLKERQKFLDRFYGTEGHYKLPMDFSRKVGPLGEVERTVTQEANKPENGGKGDGVKVIKPQGQSGAQPAPPPPTQPAPKPEAKQE